MVHDKTQHSHGPLKRTISYCMVERLEDLPWEVLTIIQFGQVFNELITGHLSPHVLSMEVSVEQHQGTGEGMHSV